MRKNAVRCFVKRQFILQADFIKNISIRKNIYININQLSIESNNWLKVQ